MKMVLGDNRAVSPIYGVIVVLLALIVGIMAWATVGGIPDAYFNAVNESSSFDPDARGAFETVYTGYRYAPLLFIMAIALFIFVFSQWVI
jgi:TRAP-type C4-dicarboxylate transport system permease small subunit